MRVQFAGMGDAPQANVNLIKLREILLERAVSDDLRTFCFDLGENYETIVAPNDKLQIAVINVIRHFDSRGRINELIARARREFPLAAWVDVSVAQTVQKEATDGAALTETAKVTIISEPRKPGPLRVFLCHASDDKPAVRELYRQLQASGIRPWLDEEDLLPGQRWKVEIPKAIRFSDAILVCLSNSSKKSDGYIKQEIEFALDIAEKQPEGTIFVIPIRLEACDVPERLREWHWVNLFDERGHARLMRALQARAAEVSADAIRVTPEAGRADGVTIVRPAADPLLIELPKLNFHLELICVPAGEFLMGSDKAKDKYASDDELPQHRVYLDEYFIGKYPVTVAQFAAFVEATSYKTTAEQEGSAYVWNGKEWKDTKGANWQRPRGPKSDVAQKPDHPVTCVSWDDAMAFCKWLSEASGRGVRLPTEAQWEKAARGTNDLLYPWGDTPPPDDRHCNFNMNVGDTTPVGKYSPLGDSPYGCADMEGNVWEWCADWFDDKEYDRRAGKAVRNPTGPESGSARVLRGGAFYINGASVRCAIRGRYGPDNRSVIYGFRVCALPIHL